MSVNAEEPQRISIKCLLFLLVLFPSPKSLEFIHNSSFGREIYHIVYDATSGPTRMKQINH